MPPVGSASQPGLSFRSPALSLVIDACRHNFRSGPVVSSGKRLWPGEIEIVALARRHRVEGMVAAFLSDNVDLLTPHPPSLIEDARRIASQGMRSASASASLREAFAAAGVDLLFIKGLTVAALAYRNPFVKMSWDADILVAQADIGAAAHTLVDLGYSLFFPRFGSDHTKLRAWHGPHKESVWVNNDGVFIELHSRLADNEALIPHIGMNSPRQIVSITGDIELPTLATEPLFTYLCVHGASSAWFRLKWIADLAGLLAPLKGDDIERLYRRAEESNASRAAAQGLLVANQLFTLPLSKLFAEELHASAAHRWLAAAALTEINEPIAPTERPLGTARIHLTQLLLKSGSRFVMSEFARQVRSSISARVLAY